MTRKTALIISTIVTTFVLLLAVGVFFTVRNATQVKAAPEQANDQTSIKASDTTLSPTLDPALVQTIQDREAAYQEMINQANARLAQAQQEEQALQAQLAALTQPTITPTVASAPVVMISMRQAAEIAAEYMHDKNVYSVELVQLNGANVYQVTLSSGDLVLVGLDGSVISVQRTSNVASNRPSHDDNHEREHDDHEGDDD
jgi:uncharacterized membrane protein YkoI